MVKEQIGGEFAQGDTVKLPRRPSGPQDARIEFAGRTHVGKVRPNNEDQFLITRVRKVVEILAGSLPQEQDAHLLQRDGYLFLVADGVGGGAAGEVASAIVAREAITHVLETAKWFFQLDDPDEEVRLRLLRETLEKIDWKLIEEGRNDPKLAGMGTTLTALTVIGAAGFIVQVGDSRAYLFRDGKLEQLTQDHTLAADMVRQGLISPEAARTHRLRHVLTNVIGARQGVQGEIVKLPLADGDRLLLCTDGLHDTVSDDRIAEILLANPLPEASCRALIDAALEMGGRDNVTVVVAALSIGAGRP